MGPARPRPARWVDPARAGSFAAAGSLGASPGDCRRRRLLVAPGRVVGSSRPPRGRRAMLRRLGGVGVAGVSAVVRDRSRGIGGVSLPDPRRGSDGGERVGPIPSPQPEDRHDHEGKDASRTVLPRPACSRLVALAGDVVAVGAPGLARQLGTPAGTSVVVETPGEGLPPAIPTLGDASAVAAGAADGLPTSLPAAATDDQLADARDEIELLELQIQSKKVCPLQDRPSPARAVLDGPSIAPRPWRSRARFPKRQSTRFNSTNNRPRPRSPRATPSCAKRS